MATRYAKNSLSYLAICQSMRRTAYRILDSRFRGKDGRFRGKDGNRHLETDIIKLTTLPQLDFVRSRSVGEGVNEAGVEFGWDFFNVILQR